MGKERRKVLTLGLVCLACHTLQADNNLGPEGVEHMVDVLGKMSYLELLDLVS